MTLISPSFDTQILKGSAQGAIIGISERDFDKLDSSSKQVVLVVFFIY